MPLTQHEFWWKAKKEGTTGLSELITILCKKLLYFILNYTVGAQCKPVSLFNVILTSSCLHPISYIVQLFINKGNKNIKINSY